METFHMGRTIRTTLAKGLDATQVPDTDHLWTVSASTAEAFVNQASSST